MFSISRLIVRMFIILVVLVQVFILPASASSTVFSQIHHTGTSEIHTYDKAERSVWIKCDLIGKLSRVLSVKEVRSDLEVLTDMASVVARWIGNLKVPVYKVYGGGHQCFEKYTL